MATPDPSRQGGHATIRVPREFLPTLTYITTWAVIDAAFSLDSRIVDVGSREQCDAEIDKLRRTIADRDAILRACDADDAIVDGDLFAALLPSALKHLHDEVREHNHEDLDELARLVDTLQKLTSWRDELPTEVLA